MSINGNVKNFIEALNDFLNTFVYDRGFTAVLTHYDADGITAGGLFSRLLANYGIEFIVRATTDLSNDVTRKFFSIKANAHVLLDMGSGDLERIHSYSDGRDVFIIDHHKVVGNSAGLHILNPELYGFDGGQTGCAGVLSGLLGYYATEDPYFLAIGLVGASGDMQLIQPVDITKHLLDLAVEKNVVDIKKGFIFFMNNSLPLHKAITWSFNPYIPGFSGRDDVGLMLIKKAGIDYPSRPPFKKASDLSSVERNKLLEEIIKYLANLGVREIKPSDITKNYVILKLENHPLLKNVDEFANLVNTAGRMGKEHMGILLTFGFRGKLVESLKDLYLERRKMIAKYLAIADRKLKIYKDMIVVVDMRDTDFNYRFSGTISTILSRSIKHSDKVVILISESPYGIKISARAPKSIVDKGLNLADIMRSLSKKFSGVGGGHNVAAGATLQRGGTSLIDEVVNIIASEI